MGKITLELALLADDENRRWASVLVLWVADCSALFTTKVSGWMTMTRRASARSSRVGARPWAF